MYNNILNGVLPTSLDAIDSISPVNLKRFINATIGWVRYKPLLIYITKRERFEQTMIEMEEKLNRTIPKLGVYFETKEFEKIHKELAYYRKNVVKHFNDFEATKLAWAKLMKVMRKE